METHTQHLYGDKYLTWNNAAQVIANIEIPTIVFAQSSDWPKIAIRQDREGEALRRRRYQKRSARLGEAA